MGHEVIVKMQCVCMFNIYTYYTYLFFHVIQKLVAVIRPSSKWGPQCDNLRLIHQQRLRHATWQDRLLPWAIQECQLEAVTVSETVDGHTDKSTPL